MKRKIAIASILFTVMLFNGCAKIADGVAYTSHSISGIDYPMKKGKIYIESTTKEDTKTFNKYNAQLNGFDNIVIENVMQCDSKPELIDVLTEHGWEITQNKSEADYQLSVSALYCGYAGNWLRRSHRDIPMKERLYYKGFTENQNGIGTPKDIENQNEEILKKVAPQFNVEEYKTYRNMFAYKYIGAPSHIKKIAKGQNGVGQPNQFTEISNNENNIALKGISTGASTMQYNSKAGLGIMAVGLLLGSNTTSKPQFRTGYKTIVTVYEPSSNKTSKVSFEGDIKDYKTAKATANNFASGIFYN